jgi:hypothetical protein
LINKFSRYIAILVVLFCTSCLANGKSTSDSFPEVGVPVEMMNKKILFLDLPEMKNSHENNVLLNLVNKNISDSTIVFNNDYGVKIFIK